MQEKEKNYGEATKLALYFQVGTCWFMVQKL